MHKKAQGLSLNTMVIAAIVLIVLLILVGVFSGYFGSFVPNLQSATERTCEGDGFDKTKSQCSPGIEKRIYGNFGDSIEEGKVCCKMIEICEDFNGDCKSAIECKETGGESKGPLNCGIAQICCI
tara:strand:- start:325 stop:699 length:375 start_codon:yes stop_codon:yes gene_type:complete